MRHPVSHTHIHTHTHTQGVLPRCFAEAGLQSEEHEAGGKKNVCCVCLCVYAEDVGAPTKSGLGNVVSSLVQRLATPRGPRRPPTPNGLPPLAPTSGGAITAHSPSHGSGGTAPHAGFAHGAGGLSVAASGALDSARSAGSSMSVTQPPPRAPTPRAPTPRQNSFGQMLTSRLSFLRGSGNGATGDTILNSAHVNTRVSSQAMHR